MGLLVSKQRLAFQCAPERAAPGDHYIAQSMSKADPAVSMRS